MKKIILVGVLILFTHPSFALSSGESCASFLKIGVGARTTAMGEAFTAVADDVTALYWNSAGLSQIKTTQFIFMHNLWFEDINHDFIGLTLPLKDKQTLGLGIIALFIDDIERRSNEYDLIPRGNFEATDNAFIISWANQGTSIGLKLISQEIDDKKGKGVVFDLGWLYTLREGLNIGLTLQNWNEIKKMKIYNKEFSYPTLLRAGISYKKDNLLLAMDIYKPFDNKLNIHLGLERDNGRFCFRGGYRYKLKNELLSGPSLGFGYKFKEVYQLDYAYVPYSDLGDSHRISMIIKYW